MKVSKGLVSATVVVAISAATTVALGRAAGHIDRSTRSVACPTGVRLTNAGLDVETARRAATHLIPTVYPTRPPGVPERTLIVQLLLLEPQKPDLPGARAWRAVGKKRCSAGIVDASWLVAVIFPEHKVVVPTTGVFFMALTPHGWDAWYRVR